jgi:hypothetical protein
LSIDSCISTYLGPRDEDTESTSEISSWPHSTSVKTTALQSLTTLNLYSRMLDRQQLSEWTDWPQSHIGGSATVYHPDTPVTNSFWDGYNPDVDNNALTEMVWDLEEMHLDGGQSQEHQTWQGHMPPLPPHTVYGREESLYSANFIEAGSFWPDNIDAPFTECGFQSIGPVRHDLAPSGALPDISTSSNALYPLGPIDPTLSSQLLNKADTASGKRVAPSQSADSASHIEPLSSMGTLPKKRKTHSAATIAKIREALVGRQVSKETREKIREANMRRSVSKKTREKLRQAAIGRYMSVESREKIRKATTGRPLTVETKAKISANCHRSMWYRLERVDTGPFDFEEKSVRFVEIQTLRKITLFTGIHRQTLASAMKNNEGIVKGGLWKIECIGPSR